MLVTRLNYIGKKIPTIESRASNIPMTKGITYVVIVVRPIKIFIEYVGTDDPQV